MVRPKILLVDDEERFVFSLAKLLTRRDYDVVMAHNGLEALEKLTQDRPDLIVLDVKMPLMDGLTALREIKARQPRVEVILLTGHATVDSAMEGLRLGAFDYLVKPCDLNQFLLKVQEALEKRRVGG